MKQSVCFCCSVVLLVVSSASAADKKFEPWLGTWKPDSGFNYAASNTIIYSELPNGMMRESDSDDKYHYDFAIDGKPYEWYFGTITWTATSKTSWDSVISAKGKDYARVHCELSLNGQVMTVTTIGTMPDGSSINKQLVWARISGTTGLIGEWRGLNAAYTTIDSSFVVSSPEVGVMRWDFPGIKGSCEGKPDGSELRCTGPNYPSGFKLFYTWLSPRKLMYRTTINGKPMGNGYQTITDNGKTLIDVYWLGPGEAKETVVFDKQ